MKRIPFVVYPGLLLLGTGVLALWFPLRAHHADGLADLYKLAPSPAAGLAYALLLLLLFAACWGAAAQPPARLRVAHVLALGALLALPAIPVYPINANDIFRYWLRGRVTAVHGANPYLVAPAAYPDDPFAALGGEWATATSPYGPLWELVDALVVFAVGERLLAGLLLFKLIGWLALIAAGWVLAQTADTHAERVRRALLWTWNPALVLMFVVDAHNDGVMLLWLLLGVWVGRRHALAGIWLMAVGALIKPIGLLPALLYGAAALRAAPTWRDRLRIGLGGPAGALALAALAFWPFGGIGPLWQRLLSEAQDGGGFSPLAWLYFLDRRLALPLPLFDFALVDAAFALFWLLALLWIMAVLVGRRAPARAAADLYYLYLLAAFNFRLWYSTWIFPWTLLEPDAPRRRAAYTLLVTAQLAAVWFAHGRRALLAGDMGLAHLIGVPLILGAPLLWLRLRPTVAPVL